MRLRFPLCTGILLLLAAAPAGADVITFDHVHAAPNNATVFGTIEVSGFTVSSPHAHVITNPAWCGGGGCMIRTAALRSVFLSSTADEDLELLSRASE